ncbi:hypothetical protein CR513_17475, partial [Mucuna pruriens]
MIRDHGRLPRGDCQGALTHCLVIQPLRTLAIVGGTLQLLLTSPSFRLNPLLYRYFVNQCKKAKSKINPHRLYTIYPISNAPWNDLSMEFVLGFPRFSKMTHFIAFHKANDATNIANLVFKEVNKLGTKLLFFTTCHLQIDRQCEVLKSWEEWLPHVEFVYNRVVHSTTNHSLFEVVYGFIPLTHLELIPFPMNKQVHQDGKKKEEYVRQLY